MSRRRFTVTTLSAAAVALVTIPPLRTRLICNVSPSAPVGIYWLTSDAPKYGDLAVVHLPLPLGMFADARRYLPRSFLLLKPVAAAAGDVVCRVGQRVWINRRRSVLVRTADGLARPLPAWRGCVWHWPKLTLQPHGRVAIRENLSPPISTVIHWPCYL